MTKRWHQRADGSTGGDWGEGDGLGGVDLVRPEVVGEGARAGATLDVGALPRPDGAPLERWLLTFPSFGFLLAALTDRTTAP